MRLALLVNLMILQSLLEIKCSMPFGPFHFGFYCSLLLLLFFFLLLLLVVVVVVVVYIFNFKTDAQREYVHIVFIGFPFTITKTDILFGSIASPYF
jgi:hypothetical protein